MEDRVRAVRVIVDYSRIISTMVATTARVILITVFAVFCVAYTVLAVRTVAVRYVIVITCMILITIITVVGVVLGATITPHLTLVYVIPIVRLPASIITMLADALTF
jgi:hypothetical protein